MNDSVKQVWRELADQVGALGTTIHDRLHDARSGDATSSDAKSGDAEHSEHDAALRDAFEQLVQAGKEFGERLGDVARDDEVKQRAKAASSSLDAALRATVDLVAGKVEHVVRNDRRDEGSRPDTSPPTV